MSKSFLEKSMKVMKGQRERREVYQGVLRKRLWDLP